MQPRAVRGENCDSFHSVSCRSVSTTCPAKPPAAAVFCAVRRFHIVWGGLAYCVLCTSGATPPRFTTAPGVLKTD
eukprot:4615128-Prymnesium_polylepis.1